MYLHLGGDILINQDKIVVVLDLDTSKKSSDGLVGENINNSKEVVYVSELGKEKSLIITTDGYYFSPISSTTLMKRSQFFEDLKS